MCIRDRNISIYLGKSKFAYSCKLDSCKKKRVGNAKYLRVGESPFKGDFIKDPEGISLNFKHVLSIMHLPFKNIVQKKNTCTERHSDKY